MSEGEISQWASHAPALLACAAATNGPILECGCGHNSTVLLHALCAPHERLLLTLEGDPLWLSHFAPLGTPWHRLHHVADWQALPRLPDVVAVAFVDHGTAPRGPLLDLVRERAEYVVMHDSECHYCGYTAPLRRFRWAYTHKHSPAWTTIAGMGPPPSWLEAALQPGDWGLPVPYRG